MCSVVGVIGSHTTQAVILNGLRRLEYRGYDSAGIACLDNIGTLSLQKAAGPLETLTERLAQSSCEGSVGIGHTRWATHGPANHTNAHPHTDCTQHLCVVHNGIIENHHQLREQLTLTHSIISDTDTELIAHLYEQELEKHHDILSAICAVATQLEGAYAALLMAQHHPDTLVAIRKGSPLCVGVGQEANYIASDVFAFAQHTRNVIFLPDESIALVSKDSVRIFDFHGHSLTIPAQEVTVDMTDGSKAGYEHFMLKEIYEQKSAIRDTIAGLQAQSDTIWQQLGLENDKAQELKSLHLIGSGTSWHAGRIAQFFFETVAKLPVSVSLASEMGYMPFFKKPACLYMAISQSGETADTLQVLRMIARHHVPTAVLTNVATSTMVRETGGAFFTKAGQEIAVASTKAFATQLAALYWLAHQLAVQKKLITNQAMDQAIEQLLLCSELIENNIERYKQQIITEHAPRYANYKQFLFLGRHISYPFALEASLKLKEISYLFSQCYPAGELKHGPIALIDDQTPIMIFSCADPVMYQKLLSNAQEVKARNGHIVAFAFEGQDELIALADCPIVLPRVAPLLAPLAMTGVMQFFVYQIAHQLQLPIDKPRNLAKSVTVE